jgi:HTH-type transcriptional regulator/antitoxin HigA
MAKNDWLLATKKPEDRVIHLRRFFGVASLSNIDDLPMAANFRRKQTKQTSVYALMAWIRQGEIQAQEVKTGVFSAAALREAIPHIRKLTDSSPGFDSILKETCAECGVAVSIVPVIHGTSVQGAIRWISKDKALVCLSTRYSWSDIFWFSFFHEVGHILKGHSKKEIFVNFGDPGFIPENKLLEEEADQFAREALIPAKVFSAFAAKRDFSRPAIEAFAESVGVPPGIVGGRLVKDDLLHWNQVAPYRTKLTISPRSFQDN